MCAALIICATAFSDDGYSDLPVLSDAENLTTQSVAGIAIIANAVFMIGSVCCAVIAGIDFVHTMAMNPLTGKDRADILAMLLSGLPMGIAAAVFIIPIIILVYGLNYAFAAFGAVLLVTGVLMIIIKPLKPDKKH